MQDWQDWQDWKSAVKGDFGCSNLQFGSPWVSIWVPWDTTLVIWCPLDHPMDPLGVQIWIFIDLGPIWGPPWAPFGGHVGDMFTN